MTQGVTCDQVRDRELIERYAAGTLPESDADLLEQHVLGCQECWAQLQQAVEVRAALREPAWASHAPDLAGPGGSRVGMAPWRKVAIAAMATAAAAIIFMPVWRSGPDETTDSATRGPATLEVRAVWESAGDLRVEWTPVVGATLYRVRLLPQAGAPVLAQASSPPLTVPSSALGTAGELMVDIEAENAIGEVIARGPATAVPPRAEP